MPRPNLPEPAATPTSTDPPNPPSPEAAPPSPPPSPRSSPYDGAAAAGGARSGKASSAGSRLAVDPGPSFDAENRPQHEPIPEIEAEPIVPDIWDEQRVRAILTAKGATLHALVAVDKDSTEWRYTEGDLDAIAGPLTSILNRYEPTRAAAHAGDELALAIGLAGYAGRSISERRAALKALADQDPVPITGVSPEPAPFPDPDNEPAPIRLPGR